MYMLHVHVSIHNFTNIHVHVYFMMYMYSVHVHSVNNNMYMYIDVHCTYLYIPWTNYMYMSMYMYVHSKNYMYIVHTCTSTHSLYFTWIFQNFNALFMTVITSFLSFLNRSMTIFISQFRIWTILKQKLERKTSFQQILIITNAYWPL